MSFPLGRLISVGTRVVSAIATGVPVVEAAASTFRGGSGGEKKAAVLTIVAAELQAVKVATGHDFASDEDVIAAAGVIIDAVAAFHKVLAHKVGAAALPQ